MRLLRRHFTGMNSRIHGRSRIGDRGFTLFEVLLALGVFMLAVTGLVMAIDTALQAALEVRQRSMCRTELESRLAYCQGDPPPVGTPRMLEASKNHGVRVEETMEPFTAQNAKGAEIPDLKKLTVKTASGDQKDSAEILIHQP